MTPMREQPEIYDLKFLKGFFRRRKKIFLAVFSVVLTATMLVAFFAPKTYVSNATFLIEGQMTDEILKGMTTSSIEERLQSITQQILVQDKLLEIIREVNLYQALDNPANVENAIRKMRDDISVRTIKAEDLDQRPSRSRYNTVAFTLSYQGKDPVTVQKVASKLASLYIQKNVQTKEQISSQAVGILQQKLSDLQERTSFLERKLDNFKVSHAAELPEAIPFNYEQISRLNTQIDELNVKIKNLEERKRTPDTAFASQTTASSTSSASTTDPWARVAQLQMQLENLRGRYSEKHPDVIKTKKELRQLEARLGISSEQNEKLQKLNELKSRQAEMKNRLGPEHPDVVNIQQEISILSKEVTISKNDGSFSDPVEKELKRLTQQRDEAQKRLNEYQRKSQMAPLVQKEYSKMSSEYDNALKQYNETMAKLTEVKLSRGLDQTQLGERFTMIDEPQVPYEHDKPKRGKIMLAGFLLSLIFGVFSMIVVEQFDHSVKTVEELEKLTKKPVMIVFPYIKTEDEIDAERSGKKFTAFFADLKNSIFSIATKSRKS